MFELIPINRKSKLREIRIIKAFLIFAFVLCLLILYIEYQKVCTYKLEICIYYLSMYDLGF